MIIAVPVATVLLAIIAIAGTFLWWRAGRASQVTALALDCGHFLGDVIESGGVEHARYVSAHRRHVENELDRLSRRLRDRKLRKLVKSALVEYRKAYAYSQPLPAGTLGLTVGGPLTRRDQTERARVGQHEAACKAFDAFDAVLARVRELDRWTYNG